MINQSVGTPEYYKLYYSSRDWGFYKYLLSEVILFAEPGPILDVGAGVGFLVEGALRWGLDCVGIEGSEAAIDLAFKRYPNIRLHKHLLSEKFQFADEAFQTIIMNQVIEHLEPEVAQNAITECLRVLRNEDKIKSSSEHLDKLCEWAKSVYC